MTQPDLEIYPDEYDKLARAFKDLERFEFTYAGDADRASFEQAVHSKLGEVGFTANVTWGEITKGGTSTGVLLPSVEITGRTRPEEETDHDRLQWGITKGLADGKPGFIREDGTLHEDPKKRIIY